MLLAECRRRVNTDPGVASALTRRISSSTTAPVLRIFADQ
jgi:hypothetical protein